MPSLAPVSLNGLKDVETRREAGDASATDIGAAVASAGHGGASVSGAAAVLICVGASASAEWLKTAEAARLSRINEPMTYSAKATRAPGWKLPERGGVPQSPGQCEEHETAGGVFRTGSERGGARHVLTALFPRKEERRTTAARGDRRGKRRRKTSA